MNSFTEHGPIVEVDLRERNAVDATPQKMRRRLDGVHVDLRSHARMPSKAPRGTPQRTNFLYSFLPNTRRACRSEMFVVQPARQGGVGGGR